MTTRAAQGRLDRFVRTMRTFRIRGKEARSLVQGGMGVGVSAHRLHAGGARAARAARGLSRVEGLVAVNVMRAVSQYAAYVRQACLSGADALVVGAGLAMDLPELAADWPRGALIPILP